MSGFLSPKNGYLPKGLTHGFGQKPSGVPFSSGLLVCIQ